MSGLILPRPVSLRPAAEEREPSPPALGIAFRVDDKKMAQVVFQPLARALELGLIPTAIRDDEIESSTDLSSHEWLERRTGSTTSIDALRVLGRHRLHASHIHVPAHLRYGFLSNVGQYRSLKNGDLLRDALNGYVDPESVRDARDATLQWVKHYAEAAAHIPEEQDDLAKMHIQRCKSEGWFLHPPVAYDAQYDIPDEWDRMASRVIKRFAHYAPKLPDLYECMTMDYDPLDTNPGYPVARGGNYSMAARLLTAEGTPSIKTLLEQKAHPFGALSDLFSKQANAWSAAGFPRELFGAAIVNSRYGPHRKATVHWVRGEHGTYTATGSTKGLYPRIRLVYIVPFLYNVLCSRLVLQIKGARMNMPGLWHTPEAHQAVAQYYAGLRSIQYYENDFSGLDTRFTTPFRERIIQHMWNEGFDRIGLATLLYAEKERGGVAYPSWEGAEHASTVVRGDMGLLSGWKVTSDLDTVYALITTLVALDQVAPQMTKDWFNDVPNIMALGDDVLMLTTAKLNSDGFNRAAQLCGAKTDLKAGHTFLKKISTVRINQGDHTATMEEIPLLSRIVQQTLWNEHPIPKSIIARVGLLSRSQSVRLHPLWESEKDALTQLIRMMECFKEVPDPWSPLSKREETQLREYLTLHPGFQAELVTSAQYRPSAALMVQQLSSMGIMLTEGIVAARKFRSTLRDVLLQDLNPHTPDRAVRMMTQWDDIIN